MPELSKAVEAEREPGFLLAVDAIGLAAAGGMLGLLAFRAIRNLRELSSREPPASRRAEPATRAEAELSAD